MDYRFYRARICCIIVSKCSDKIPERIVNSESLFLTTFFIITIYFYFKKCFEPFFIQKTNALELRFRIIGVLRFIHSNLQLQD
jgi:hypothetical protein